MSNFLVRNKTTIEVCCTVLQALAVVAGVMFAIYEFGYKRQVSNSEAKERVLTLYLDANNSEGNAGLTNYYFDLVGETNLDKIHELTTKHGEFNDRAQKTVALYTRLRVCLSASACEEKLAQQLFCGRAFMDTTVLYKAWTRPKNWAHPSYPLEVDNVFDFWNACALSGYKSYMPDQWISRRSGNWDVSIQKVVEEFDRRWIEALRKQQSSK